MAKWKNALLISTIVAPIAFGASPLGDAFAQADRPSSTNVQVHKMETTTDGTDSQNVLWGSGSEKDQSLLQGWNPATSDKFEFTAIQLNTTVKSVITEMDSDTGAPVFENTKTVLSYGGKDYTWADLLKAEPAAGYTYTNNKDDQGNTKPSVNDYTVSLTLPSGMTEAEFITDVEAFTKNTAIEENTVAGTGIASFNGLDNGQWLIFETSKDDDVKEKSVPMFLNLPTQKPDASATDKWYGTGSTDALHLYPKNYTDSGDIIVDKKDDKTGASVDGAWVGLFQGISDDQRKKALTATKDLDPTKTSAADIIALLEGETVGLTADQIIGVQMTGATGTGTGTTFTSLNPGETYQVLELVEPAGYLINSDMSSFTLSTADDTTDDEDANDGFVHYKGGTFKLNNFEPGVTKKVQVGSTATQNDTTQGVDRGQDFDWLINADLPKDPTLITADTTYVFTDSVPYQTNWTDFAVDIAGLGEMFTVMHNGWTGQGGATGHHVAYDNQSTENVTYWDQDNGGAVVTDTAHTLDQGVTVKATTADYANLTATGVALPAGVTDAASWVAWLNSNVHISGYSSYYEYVDGGRTIKGKGDAAPTDGQLKIELSLAAQILFAQIADTNKTPVDGEGGLNITLGARANSAAQASKIENDVELKLSNPWDVETRTDTASTFDAGWEIVKTTADGETPLAGAGFDLAVAIPAGDNAADKDKRAALLNNFYQGKNADGTAVVYDRKNATDTNPDTKPWLDMFYQAAISDQFTDSEYSSLDTYAIATNDDLTPEQKKSQIMAIAYNSAVTSDDDITLTVANNSNNLHDKLISMMRAADYETGGQGVLYFMHKDATTGAYMPDMNMGSENVVMGDVIWTPVAAWATTHITGTDGYLQYCGLAAGQYALIERQAPAGYTLITDTITLNGTKFDHAKGIELGMPGTKLSDGSTPASGVINGKADIPADPNNPKDTDDIQIINYEKSIFPLVGGLGTLFAVIAGLLAMGLALLKRKKDMKNEA